MYRPSFVLQTALICAFICPQGSLGQYSGGSGTEADPYRISTVPDWQKLMTTATDWNRRFILTADLDMQGVALSPIGSLGKGFSGVFDGNSHVIRNGAIRYRDASSYVGLFGYLEQKGQIHHIGVEAMTIVGGPYVGALVGYCSGDVSLCYATGSVTGSAYVGGLVGYNNGGSLSVCYASVSVRGDMYVGGLVGTVSFGKLTACYATGRVTGMSCGGLVDDAGGAFYDGNIISCFWDVEASNCSGSGAGKGLTTRQMKSLAVYRDAGWSASAWIINDGQDYPRLAWQNLAGIAIPEPGPVPLLGSGTAGDPYQVWSPSDFALLSWHSAILDKHITLVSDLDLSGIRLYPIGDLAPFTGVFEGGGHIIRNVAIGLPKSDLVGLFGYLGPYGQVRNIGVEDLMVVGRECVGGLVGCNSRGCVTSSYVTGSVQGSMDVGGVVGMNSPCGNLTACYAMGLVGGDNLVGGLVGRNDYGSLVACYASVLNKGTLKWIGALVGESSGTIVSCFWDAETSGKAASSGGKGLTTRQMQSLAVYRDAGWFGKGWMIDDGQDYPRLAWQNPAGIAIPEPGPVPLLGSGTAADPYQVGSPSDFALLSWHSSILDKHITLVSDLDLSGIPLYPIGDLGRFTGVFDGNRHVIRNGTIKGIGDYAGLFGYLSPGGQIRNVRVEDVTVVGAGNVGGLVAYNYRGTITSCSTSGSVAGDYDVGGLVGRNPCGSITSCCSACSVQGRGYVGGLVGSIRVDSLSILDKCSGDCNRAHDPPPYWVALEFGTLRDCYASGPVRATLSYYAGGLVGFCSGQLTNCYSTGRVDAPKSAGGLVGEFSGKTTSTCFWDIESSGQNISAAGTGKTTGQMKTRNTFTSAGWDFAGERTNGLKEIWWMPVDGVDYPRLSWQVTP